jgi:hypothetical protein
MSSTIFCLTECIPFSNIPAVDEWIKQKPLAAGTDKGFLQTNAIAHVSLNNLIVSQSKPKGKVHNVRTKRKKRTRIDDCGENEAYSKWRCLAGSVTERLQAVLLS